MDETDSCHLPKPLDHASGLRACGDDGAGTGNNPFEEIFCKGNAQRCPGSVLPYPVAAEPLDCGRANDASLESASCHKSVHDEREGWPHAPIVDIQCNRTFASEAFQIGKHVGGKNDHSGNGCCHVATEPASVDKILYDCHTCKTTCLASRLTHPSDNGNHETSSRGVDENDQGQVLPSLNLNGDNAEYSQQHPSNQYYAKTEVELQKSPRSDATVTESSGPRRNSQTSAIGNTSRFDDALSSCAISQTGVATAQGQFEPNSKLSPETSPQEVVKRKVHLEEDGASEDSSMSGVMKKQKVSPTVQSGVQYNQNVLSVPKEYKVSGSGNYIFDTPNHCTFHLYQNRCGDHSQKQHAFEWAGVATQPDSGCKAGEVPAQALETVAKLVANTTNWKTFARRLPMSENGNLELDIGRLEDCQGTTSDKTAAVLMRWWKDHPKQGDAVAMKARLKEGLESCSLIRLARSLDKYL